MCRSPALDHHARIGRLSERLSRLINGGATRIEVDLSLVAQVDSKLVGCLIAAQAASHRRGATLLIRPSPAVDRWLEVCRVDRLIGRT